MFPLYTERDGSPVRDRRHPLVFVQSRRGLPAPLGSPLVDCVIDRSVEGPFSLLNQLRTLDSFITCLFLLAIQVPFTFPSPLLYRLISSWTHRQITHTSATSTRVHTHTCVHTRTHSRNVYIVSAISLRRHTGLNSDF